MRFKYFALNNSIVTASCLIGVWFITITAYNGSESQNLYLENDNLLLNSDNISDINIDNIKERYLEPPSELPYNLHALDKNDHLIQKRMKSPEAHFLPQVIKLLFSPDEGRRNGYFVEAGALDGEYFSNTLYLELQLGWSGLLVEPSRESYRKLQKKHRKAWTCHCCLGVKPLPYETSLASVPLSLKKKYMGGIARETNIAKSSIVGSGDHLELLQQTGFLQYEKVQCLPIGSILKALSVSKIDLFSLDVEGTELGILENFPWDEVEVEVWIVEHKDPKRLQSKNKIEETDQNFISWFENKGYDMPTMDSLGHDYVFIKKNSTLIEKFYKAKH